MLQLRISTNLQVKRLPLLDHFLVLISHIFTNFSWQKLASLLILKGYQLVSQYILKTNRNKNLLYIRKKKIIKFS